jgi:6-phosphogluconolactonase
MNGADEPTRLATRVYVGGTTHTDPAGIHVFDLVDDDCGPSLVARSHVAGVEHPTFLALHPTRPVLYSVSETTLGEVVSFRVHPDGALTEWQRATAAGDGPCHVSTDGAHVLVANYVSGSATAHALAADGAFGELVWTVDLDGRGPHPRQEAPHAHCALHAPSRPSANASVHVVDLGTDRIRRFDIGSGGFRPAGELVVSVGSGPRHLAFHPHGRAAFVVGELDNTLAALAVDGDGDLVLRQVVPTLPDGFTGHSLAAAVEVDPAGRRVYVSNRGHDSIAVFAYRPDDAPLTPLGHVPSGGIGPRDIAIDRTGSLLLAANQHSGTVTGFDLAAGLPRPLGVLAAVSEPTCIIVTGGVA